jgi:hypothetical protein
MPTISQIIKINFILSGIILLTSSCNETKPTEKSQSPMEDTSEITHTENMEIPYTIMQRYFVLNTFTKDNLPQAKIDNQATFESIFGMATVMGENGRPTSIDFSKEYVIAITDKISSQLVEFTPRKLYREKNQLIFEYTKKTDIKEQSYTMRPLLMIKVSKEYQGEVVLKEV